MTILGEGTLRNRRFFLNTANQFVGKIINIIVEKFDTLYNKTFNVRVSNQNDYTKAISELNLKLNNLETLLGKIEKKDTTFTVPDVNVPEIKPPVVNIPEIKVPDVKVPKIETPDVTVNIDTKGIVKKLDEVKKQVAKIPQPVIPKQEKVLFPSKMSLAEASSIIKGLDEVRQSVVALPRKMPKERQGVDFKPVLKELKELKKALSNLPQAEFPESISVNNFPVQKYPSPVTNISINPLRGVVHTTSTTVSTVLSTLPGYGVLANRRSLIFQNLSASVDIYIGGSDVTVNNGYKLEAGSVSPSFDSGPRQIWYGITSSGSADVRCVEVANTNIGG